MIRIYHQEGLGFPTTLSRRRLAILYFIHFGAQHTYTQFGCRCLSARVVSVGSVEASAVPHHKGGVATVVVVEGVVAIVFVVLAVVVLPSLLSPLLLLSCVQSSPGAGGIILRESGCEPRGPQLAFRSPYGLSSDP